ncbi:MAG: DNA primase, partial [Candidatus Omnitrophica bacterium]|nr:DNA primase [Candidatus Omnitrophota bacterium]
MISVVQSKEDARPFRLEVSWAELVVDLTTPRRCACAIASCARADCAEKNGPGWCPCTFAGDRRLKAGVEQVTFLVADIDHQPPGNYNALLEEAGIAHVVHSTHSHRDDDWCLRVVVPLSRPVTPTEWPRFRAAALARYQLPADEATKDASRLYYLPSASSDGPFLGFEEKGKVLDVDEILGAPAVAGLAPTPPSKEPAPKPAAAPGVLNPRKGVADMDWLRATLKRLKDDASQALANLMLAGKPLAVEGGRD